MPPTAGGHDFLGVISPPGAWVLYNQQIGLPFDFFPNAQPAPGSSWGSGRVCGMTRGWGSVSSLWGRAVQASSHDALLQEDCNGAFLSLELPVTGSQAGVPGVGTPTTGAPALGLGLRPVGSPLCVEEPLDLGERLPLSQLPCL